MSSLIKMAIVRRERNDNDDIEEPDDHRAQGMKKGSRV
jgi:hypothetical protein